MSADPKSLPAPEAAPSPGLAAQATSTSDASATQGGPADEFVLTPELVEEEAIRGDFMLRWAVILLAMLLGWTVVNDTLTLVRIRSGEYMAGHGVLPPRADVFSTAAEGREWVNLGWLGDLILAGVYQISGEYALTILAALLAAVTFRCVVQTSMSGVSTWWGSIVAMLGAVACFPHLTPNSIWTLLGVAITCRLLQRFDDDPAKPSLWALVPCFWLWANLDRHAFVGLAILLLWGIGRTATNLGLQAPKRVALSRIWAPIGVVCLAVMIHPWHYHVWTSPWLALGVEYPEIRQYGSVTDEFAWQWYSILSREFWAYQDLFVLFALSTAVLALVSMVLNLKEVPFEHLLMYFGINGLAVAGGYFVPAAAIVNVVIATLNSQVWYRRSFSQEYSVNAFALAYSRGGRALTVLAVFGMAYLAITGWLMGADGRRIGTGFDQDLASNISSYVKVMSEGPEVDEKRPFNFRVEQGDLLIWVGYKPFVDRRLTLFALGDENLLELHRQTRVAIKPAAGGGNPQALRDIWQKTFATYSLNLALPRLSGIVPDYDTFVTMLLQRQDWYPVTFEAATASFYWRHDERAIMGFIENREGFDPVREVFQKSMGAPPDAGMHWPSAPTFTDRYLLLPNPAIPEGIQLARHFDALLRLGGEVEVSDPNSRLAMAYLAVRHARHGLSDNPNIGEGWRILSRAYMEIYNIESMLVANTGTLTSAPLLRLSQSIGALQLATVCDPGNPNDQEQLFLMHSDYYFSTPRRDLMARHLREFESLTGRLTLVPETDPNYEAALKARIDFLKEVDDYKSQVGASIDDALAERASRMEMAIALRSEGFPGMALELIEGDLTEADSDPAYRVVWGNLLLENGRIEEAWELLERNSPAFSEPDEFGMEHMAVFSQWTTDTAVTNLLGGRSARAAELLDAVSQPGMRQIIQSVLMMAPLSDKPIFDHGVWGGYRPGMLGGLAHEVAEHWATQQLLAASADIEGHRSAEAARRLEFILERTPHTSVRPLVAMYLSLITEQPVYPRPDVDLPIWGGMFADDPPADTDDSSPMSPEEDPATDDGDATDTATTEPDAEMAETDSTDAADSSEATPEEPADEEPPAEASVPTGEAESSAGDSPVIEASDEAPSGDSPADPLPDDDIE